MMLRARLTQGSSALVLALAISVMSGCYGGSELTDINGLASKYWVSFSEDTQDCTLLLGEFRLSSSRHRAALGLVEKEVRLIIDRAPQEGPVWTLRGDLCNLEETKRPVALCLSSLQRIIYTPNILSPERQCTAEVVTPQSADIEMLTRVNVERVDCCERYNRWSLGEEIQTVILEISQRGELSGEISQRVGAYPYSSSSNVASMPSDAYAEDTLSCRTIQSCTLSYRLFATPTDASTDLSIEAPAVDELSTAN